MRLRKLGLLAILPLAFSACSSSDSTDDPPPGRTADASVDQTTQTDSSPGADVQKTDSQPQNDGQVQGDSTADGQAGDNAKLDEDRFRTSIAEKEGFGVSVLPSIKGVMHIFIEEDPTLSLDAGVGAAGAAANASAIEKRAASALNICNKKTQTALPTYSVEIVEPCTLPNGLTIQGSVSVTVNQTTPDSGPPTITVTFKFTDFIVNNTKINGDASVSTNDLVAYPMKANFTQIGSLGAMTFDGKGELLTPDGGSMGGKMTGKGTFTGSMPAGDGGASPTEPNLGSNDWICTQTGATSYEVADLTRFLSDCYANGGTAKVIKEYSCAKKVLKMAVSTTTTLTWLPTTPKDPHTINVAITTKVGDKTTSGEPKALNIPWACTAVPSPDGGAPDAGADAVAPNDAAAGG